MLYVFISLGHLKLYLLFFYSRYHPQCPMGPAEFNPTNVPLEN